MLKLILVGVGNVIVPYDEAHFRSVMAAKCCHPSAGTLVAKYLNSNWEALLTGKEPEKSLHKIFVSNLGYNGLLSDFQNDLCSSIGRNHEIEKIVQHVSQSITVALVCNSVKTQKQHFISEIPFIGQLYSQSHVYFSCDIGKTKPHPDFFEHVVERERLVRANPLAMRSILYLDNDFNMIVNAAKLGMQTMQVNGPVDIVTAFERRGIDCGDYDQIAVGGHWIGNRRLTVASPATTASI